MWNYLISNKILNQNNRFRIHQNHLEKLIQIKSNINNKNSDYLKYRKLNKSYNIENDYKKYKIHYDNLKLCNNLDSIYYHPGPYNKNTIVPKYCPVFDKKKYHCNKCEYFINLAKDNIKFFNKFNSIKPVYQRKFFLNENNNFLTRSNSQDLNKTINYNNPNLNFVTFQKFKMNLMKEIKSCGMKLSKKKKNKSSINIFGKYLSKKNKIKTNFNNIFYSNYYNTNNNGFNFKNKNESFKNKFLFSKSKYSDFSTNSYSQYKRTLSAALLRKTI